MPVNHSESYEDEAPLGYDAYVAQQRLDEWESRRVCPLDDIYEEPDYAPAIRILEAVMWCAVFILITFCGMLLLTM